MPNFAANLSMLFTEHYFLDRFNAAAACGFKGVEFLFPYEWPANEIRSALTENNLKQALFNMPPGDWNAGYRGLGAIPGRESEFFSSLNLALGVTLGFSPDPSISGYFLIKGVIPVPISIAAVTQIILSSFFASWVILCPKTFE